MNSSHCNDTELVKNVKDTQSCLVSDTIYITKLHRIHLIRLYLVTVSHVSHQGQFDVFHKNSSFLLKAHDIENERTSGLIFSVDSVGFVL